VVESQLPPESPLVVFNVAIYVFAASRVMLGGELHCFAVAVFCLFFFIVSPVGSGTTNIGEFSEVAVGLVVPPLVTMKYTTINNTAATVIK